MTPSLLQETAGGALLSVKVQPRSSKNQVGAVLGAQLKISITAPPVDGEANAALVRFLAETLGCPRGAVQIVKGETSRNKSILLKSLSIYEVAAKLGFETA